MHEIKNVHINKQLNNIDMLNMWVYVVQVNMNILACVCVSVCLTWTCCSLLVVWGGLARVKWSLGVTQVSRLSSWVEARLVAT